MTTRITNADLKNTCDRINEVTGHNTEAWTRSDDGKWHANIGTYYVEGAYGGYKLVQLTTDGGGIREITSGFISKRELYYQMQAFLSGISVNK